MKELLEFYSLRPKNLTLIRLLSGINDSTTDVGCGANLEQLQLLLATAERTPYHDQRCGWVRYKGTYLRLCHDIEPRDWLDGGRPRLTEATAVGYPGFMIDVDAVKSGDSATDAELAAALRVTEEILQWLSEYISLSCTLTLMSGNGFQICLRGRLELQDSWLAAELLLRMKQRWAMVDPQGYKPSVGPAAIGTRKCKGIATLERPHRVVRVEFATPGDYWLTADDLTRMIRELPEAEHSAQRRGDFGPAIDEWGAVQRLPIRDVLHRLFGGEMCPICKSDDRGFAVLSANLCVCLHSNRCPAAASGHRGFTAAHAFGYKLFDKWRGYTDLERHEIIEAAKAEGFQLVHEGAELVARPPDPLALQAMEDLFTPEPSRRKSIRPSGRWIVHGPNYGEAAEHMRVDILRAYCPRYLQDHNECGEAQPILFDGGTWCYHQELGIFVTPLRRGDDTEEGAVERILKAQVERGILYSDPTGKPRMFSPSARALLKSFEAYCANVGYFRDAPVGIACRDGFLRLDGDKLIETPHSPANRARGRLRMRMAEAVASGAKMAAAVDALHRLIGTLLPNHTQQDRVTILTVLLEQWGAVLTRMRPEVRMSFLLLGPPDVGKSVLSQIARALFERIGLDVIAASIDDINAKFPPIGLATAAASIIEELDPNMRAHKTARLKLLSEGKPWSLDRKNRDAITCTNSIFMMATSNGEPSFAEGSGALAKRWSVIRFPDQAPPILDHDLCPRFIREHLDGLALAAVVASARLVTGHRSVIPQDSKLRQDSAEVLVEPCPIKSWFEAQDVVFTEYPSTPHELLYMPCKAWLDTHGRKSISDYLTPKAFTERLNKIPGIKSRISNSKRFFNVGVIPGEQEATANGHRHRDAL